VFDGRDIFGQIGLPQFGVVLQHFLADVRVQAVVQQYDLVFKGLVWVGSYEDVFGMRVCVYCPVCKYHRVKYVIQGRYDFLRVESLIFDSLNIVQKHTINLLHYYNFTIAQRIYSRWDLDKRIVLKYPFDQIHVLMFIREVEFLRHLFVKCPS